MRHKTRGHFPTDDAAIKLIWLAVRNITADWSRASIHCKKALNQFAIVYDDRFLKDPAQDGRRQLQPPHTQNS